MVFEQLAHPESGAMGTRTSSSGSSASRPRTRGSPRDGEATLLRGDSFVFEQEEGLGLRIGTPQTSSRDIDMLHSLGASESHLTHREEDMVLEEVLGMGMRVSSARYSSDGREGNQNKDGNQGSSRRGSFEAPPGAAPPVGGKPPARGSDLKVRGSDPKGGQTGTASRRHAPADKLRSSVSGGSSREASRERVLYCQPTGPNPLNHRDD